MKTKMFLATMCLSFALCTQAFSGDASPQSGCRKGAFRGWLKAVFTVQCKTCIFCKDPPAPEPAPADAPKTDAPKTDAPKTDAPKTDAPKTGVAPAPPAPAANKTSGPGPFQNRQFQRSQV